MQVGQKCNIEDMRRAKNTPPFISEIIEMAYSLFIDCYKDGESVLSSGIIINLALKS